MWTLSSTKQPPLTYAPCCCRGDIINAPDFAEGARIPDPARLVKAYNQSAATLNLLRGFSTGKLTWLAAAMSCCSWLVWHLCLQVQLAPETSVGWLFLERQSAMHAPLMAPLLSPTPAPDRPGSLPSKTLTQTLLHHHLCRLPVHLQVAMPACRA